MQTFIHSDPTPALILPRLYLGSIGAQKNLAFLQAHRVTHILTIGNNLPIFYGDRFEYLHLVVQDGEKEDIRKYFERCLRFIERGRGGQGEVTGKAGGGEEEKREDGRADKQAERKEGTEPMAAAGEGMGDAAVAERRHDGEGTAMGTGVLLHCFAGRSRSVTILLAYLLTLVHRNSAAHPDVQLVLSSLPALPVHPAPPVTALAPTPPPTPPPPTPTVLSQLNLSRLFDFVKAKRPEIKPNAGFVAQLLVLERELVTVNERFAGMTVSGGEEEGGEGREVARAVERAGHVGNGVVIREEREHAVTVNEMAGKERGEEWRSF